MNDTTQEYEVILPTESHQRSMVELVTKAEIDTQISTAKQYPRSIKQFITDATEMVTINESVAESCNYGVPRAGKVIEGASIRFAELILGAWGNCRTGARVVHDDGRFVTAQGVCHDLQRNTAITMEVKRRITDKKGSTFKDDMIGVTGNAAASIALRNAILRTIPKAFWEPIYLISRDVALGKSKPMANRRADTLTVMQKFGVTPEMIFAKFEIKGIEDLTIDHLSQLSAMRTSIKSGEYTAEEFFAPPMPLNEAKGTEGVKEKLKRRKAKDAGDDPNTGEISSTPQSDSPLSPSEPPVLQTVDDAKIAVASLLAALKSAPVGVRPGVFIEHFGSEIVDALKQHGQGLLIAKIKNLGIKLEE